MGVKKEFQIDDSVSQEKGQITTAPRLKLEQEKICNHD